MHSQFRRSRAGSGPTPRCAALAALLAGVLIAGPSLAGPPPPPPPPSQSPPPPAVYRAPPPPVYVPAPPPGPPVYVQPQPPPPLPIAMRVIYAPFYLTGLILRYGVYYVVVAPIEVLGRALGYGVEGGVERDPGAGSR